MRATSSWVGRLRRACRAHARCVSPVRGCYVLVIRISIPQLCVPVNCRARQARLSPRSSMWTMAHQPASRGGWRARGHAEGRHRRRGVDGARPCPRLGGERAARRGRRRRRRLAGAGAASGGGVSATATWRSIADLAADAGRKPISTRSTSACRTTSTPTRSSPPRAPARRSSARNRSARHLEDAAAIRDGARRRAAPSSWRPTTSSSSRV